MEDWHRRFNVKRRFWKREKVGWGKHVLETEGTDGNDIIMHFRGDSARGWHMKNSWMKKISGASHGYREKKRRGTAWLSRSNFPMRESQIAHWSHLVEARWLSNYGIKTAHLEFTVESGALLSHDPLARLIPPGMLAMDWYWYFGWRQCQLQVSKHEEWVLRAYEGGK